MRKRFYLTICTYFCFVISYAQCNDLLRAARDYKDKGKYGMAVKFYNQLEEQCSKYFTETVKGERDYCKNKMNQPKSSTKQPVLDDQQSSVFVSYDDSLFEAIGGYRDIQVTCGDDFFYLIKNDWLELVSQSGNMLVVRCLPNNSPTERQCDIDIACQGRDGSSSVTITFHQKARTYSSQNNPEIADTPNQQKPAKVSFDAGSAKPNFENAWKMIGGLEEDKNLVLKIEIPWCRNQYSIKLIEKRIQNIIDYFVASGIDVERISSSIIVVDVEEDYHFITNCQDSEKDIDHKISDHITLINVEEGYNACDSAWLKTMVKPKYGIAELSDALSKTKILFDFGEDIPKISDSYANICKTVKILNVNSKLKLVVEGYISSDEDRNLAQRRANRVRDMFIQLGVNSDQIETAAYMVEDPQNRQNISDISRKEHRAAIFRIEKREPKNIKIMFDYDKDTPKISDYADVDEHIDFLKSQSVYKLIVEGYSCDQGSEMHNRDLAQRRANNIRELFIEKGVDPSLIETSSYTVNDPQNRQSIINTNECDAVICRIVRR